MQFCQVFSPDALKNHRIFQAVPRRGGRAGRLLRLRRGRRAQRLFYRASVAKQIYVFRCIVLCNGKVCNMGNLGWDIYCFVFILRFFLPKGNVRPLRQRIFLQGRAGGWSVSTSKKVKREAAAQRHPAKSERKALFPRSDGPYVRRNAFQTEKALYAGTHGGGKLPAARKAVSLPPGKRFWNLSSCFSFP